MKVGILTFHFVANYGAVFQAYALKKQIEKQGHVVEIIDYRPETMRISWNIEAYKERKKSAIHFNHNKSFFKAILLSLYGLLSYWFFLFKELPVLRKKYLLFESFRNEHLRVKPNNESSILEQYDIIICGSDQVWNLNITDGFDDYYFASKCNKNQIKASYAASVGDISIISKNKDIEAQFLNLIKQFDFISVRENNLADYINSQKIQAKCVSDPTLLLSYDEYSPIYQNEPVIQEDYILVYHLIYDKRIDNIAKRLGKINKYKVVIINGTQSGGSNVRKDVGPCEFLGLLSNAKLVITNSFHGVALSLVFHKNFYVSLPKIRKDRIYSLLANYGLNNRILDLGPNNVPNNLSIDYSMIIPLINRNKDYSIEYLSSVFEKYVK